MRPVTPPPADFNFAQHLIASNAVRAAKTALIDDVGTLTYGELTEQIRRFAGGLQAMGIRQPTHVLLQAGVGALAGGHGPVPCRAGGRVLGDQRGGARQRRLNGLRQRKRLCRVRDGGHREADQDSDVCGCDRGAVAGG